MDVNESLLRAIFATVARQTFRPEDVAKVVCPTAGSEKQVAAYNLCDGRTPQAEIGKKAKIDKGNLSRSLSRWIEAGVVVRLGTDQHPLHVYPLSSNDLKVTR